jgi:adenylate cyclase
MEQDILKAIELAIAHETEARRSYLALADASDDPELKRILEEIAHEEAGHEATLRSRLRLYRQKHLLRDTISRYVSPQMCAEILENPSLLQLGGERRKVTILFADIKGFTALSEKMEPEKVVEVLNTFFTEMVELVFQHQGTLDKFLGDALMVDFGVPVEIPRTEFNAVACALAMHRRLGEMRAAGLTPIQGIRIGINTGEAIVGNIGSDKRMDFTVVGDVVNVAARLQELTKELEAETLVSEATYLEVSGQFRFQPVPPVVLRGRRDPTAVYRLLAEDQAW